ncbi:MAG: hypothetical protein HOU81_07110 [Hamadaea sp.]|uniref:hypothetical protein n=1 Tax=Hamadaea sp. TaxID=2024425 RepID=UPI0017CCC0E2|nr:hypothetical protein [Hamadaea sp.]NUR70572.1 hypothetical protein [Hamadaea sp.]NUT19299.1 hypothetical protein [Hamadaea sp.]
MATVRNVLSVAGHLLLVVAGIVAVLVTTSDLAYPALRHALVALVAALCVVSVLGRFRRGWGPVSGTMAARLVRAVGTALAGLGAVGVILGFAQGGFPSDRASGGVRIYTVVLVVNLAAVLAATSRDSGLTPRAMVSSVGFGLIAAAMFAAAVPTLPPGLVGLGVLLVAGAGVGAGLFARPAEGRLVPGLLAMVTACQAVYFVAAVLYRYGPDAWMPYAGPGPLTPEGQLDQNRAEAIDPYGVLLLLGLIAAMIVVGAVMAARHGRVTQAPVAVPGVPPGNTAR